MSLDGEVFVVPDGGGADPPGSHRPGAPRSQLVVCVVGCLLLVTAVLAFRQGAPSTAVAAPTPVTAVTGDAAETAQRPALLPTDPLTWTGIGRVRVGMSDVEYAEVMGGDRNLSVIAQDTVHGCTQIQGFADAVVNSNWVWIRDSAVTAVGVRFGGQPLPTDLGVTLGVRAGRDDPGLATWQWPPDSAVPVARTQLRGRIATVADTDADGRLDYAAVATQRGDECRPDLPADDPAVNAVEGMDEIEGSSIAGVSIGTAVEQLRRSPGWAFVGDSGADCQWFGTRGGGFAFARDTVVGLSADAVTGGPVTGRSVDEAMAAAGVGPEAVTAAADGALQPVIWTAADGRSFRLLTHAPVVLPPGVDIVVPDPAAGPGDWVIDAISLGDTCGLQVYP